MKLLLPFFVLASLVACAAAAPPLPALDAEAAGQISFRRDVWPILKRDCWGCHSGGNPKGGLSMDSVSALERGGDSGPALVAGKPDESLLVEMIVGDEPEMPKQRPPLSIAKIHLLRQWILAGAKDDAPAGAAKAEVVIPETYDVAPAVTSVDLDADGKLLAAACRSEVVLVDLAGDAPPRRLPTDCDQLTCVAFTPDGTRLVAVGGSPARFGEMIVFDPADGRQLASRRMGYDTLFRGAIAPDGKAVALAAADGAVYIVPLEGDAPARQIELHSDWVLDVAYTPDGKMLVSVGRDKTTKVSSVDGGRLLRSVDSSSELVRAAAADDKFAISAGRNGQLLAYELTVALSGIEVPGMGGNGARPVNKRDQYTKPLESQPGAVFDLATNADRSLLAVAGAYNQIRVYRLADRQRVTLVENVPGPVYGVALNAAGTLLAAGCADGRVLLVELPSGKLLKSLVPVPVKAAVPVSVKDATGK